MIDGCDPARSKRCTVLHSETLFCENNYYTVLCIAYYGHGLAEIGINYVHVNQAQNLSRLPPFDIPLHHLVAHPISEERCSDTNDASGSPVNVYVPVLSNGKILMQIHNIKDGAIRFTMVASESNYKMMHMCIMQMIEDFNMMGPYTNPPEEGLAVTDQHAQRILTMAFLRMQYEQGITNYKPTLEEEEEEEHCEYRHDYAKLLIDRLTLDAVNRYLEPCKLFIKLGEPLQDLFQDVKETLVKVSGDDLPPSVNYFRYLAECHTLRESESIEVCEENPCHNNLPS